MQQLTDNLFDAIRKVVEQETSNLHTSLIGKINKVNTKTVDVKPMVNRVFKGESVELPIFPEVPLFTLQGSDTNWIHMPVAVNDYCILIVLERSIEAWYDGKDNKKPKQERTHDYSDCFALVGINNKSGAKVIPTDGRTLMEGDTLQNGDYEHNGKRVQTGDYTHTGNYTQEGNYDLTGDETQTGDKNITGDVTITGNLTVSGNITVGGAVSVGTTLTVSSDATIGGISFLSHVHPGDSGGITGVPE